MRYSQRSEVKQFAHRKRMRVTNIALKNDSGENRSTKRRGRHRDEF